jgi:hypothetical protein
MLHQDRRQSGVGGRHQVPVLWADDVVELLLDALQELGAGAPCVLEDRVVNLQKEQRPVFGEGLTSPLEDLVLEALDVDLHKRWCRAAEHSIDGSDVDLEPSLVDPRGCEGRMAASADSGKAKLCGPVFRSQREWVHRYLGQPVLLPQSLELGDVARKRLEGMDPPLGPDLGCKLAGDDADIGASIHHQITLMNPCKNLRREPNGALTCKPPGLELLTQVDKAPVAGRVTERKLSTARVLVQPFAHVPSTSGQAASEVAHGETRIHGASLTEQAEFAASVAQWRLVAQGTPTSSV